MIQSAKCDISVPNAANCYIAVINAVISIFAKIKKIRLLPYRYPFLFVIRIFVILNHRMHGIPFRLR